MKQPSSKRKNEYAQFTCFLGEARIKSSFLGKTLNPNKPYIFVKPLILLALPTKANKDIVFRFIIEYYSSLRDFGPLGNIRSIFFI
jgi:hypothetical protein